MSKWQTHIEQIKTILELLNKEFSPYLKQESKKEKESQLHTIEKTINDLQKSNINIPQELRELKLRLLGELELFKEAEKANNAIYEIFSEYFKLNKSNIGRSRKPKDTPRKYRSTNNITVKDLIDSGLLHPPVKLKRKYKGKIFYATITNEGKISTAIDGKLEYFNSLSTAAETLTGKSINGWDWWYIADEPQKRTLDYYRKKYKEKHETERRG